MTDHPVSRIRAWLSRSLSQDRRRGLELALRAADEPVEPLPAGTQSGADEQEPLEEALEGHRQLLETVVNQMPAAVCLIRSSDLRLQLINPAYQAIAPGKQMLGKTLDELVAGDRAGLRRDLPPRPGEPAPGGLRR